MDFKLKLRHIGIGLVALVFMATSCGAKKNGSSDTVSTNNVDTTQVVSTEGMLSGLIQTHTPYCGGMKPTPEMEKGVWEPVMNADFYIYQDSMPTKKSDFIHIKTDAEGKFSVKLDPGDYHIVQAQKLLSLEEFIKKNTPSSELYRLAPESCFETWKNSPDFSFSMTTEAKSETFTENHGCFIGANPCLKYVGPYPP